MFLNLKNRSIVNRLTRLHSLLIVFVFMGIFLFLYFYMDAILDPSIQYLYEHDLTKDITQEQWLAAHQHSIFIKYMMGFSIFLFAGMLFAILASAWITRRSLSSLYDLTHKMNEISDNSLKKRIDLLSWPIELRDFGLTFNHMLDRLDKSFNRIAQFSADIAHELRVPIQNLMSSTELALDKNTSVDDQKNCMITNLEELQHLSRVIENLLFLARSENNQIDVQKNDINIRDELTKILEFYQAAAEEKNIKIKLNGTGMLHANRSLLRRAICNVLSNALTYTPINGEVEIYIKTINDSLEVMVSDTGIGIPKEHLQNIFDRFYRVDDARVRQNIHGVGLGLALVKSIVEWHQGKVFISSELGQGTTVRLVFPH